MNDEFEQKLSRQLLKEIPDEWRAEILIAAKSAVASQQRNEDRSNQNPISWWHELFWPHPKAWAGLAAIWILILTLHFSTSNEPQVVAKKSTPPSPEVIAELQKQRLLFAELIGSTEARVADRQKLFLPRPRSERVKIVEA